MHGNAERSHSSILIFSKAMEKEARETLLREIEEARKRVNCSYIMCYISIMTMIIFRYVKKSNRFLDFIAMISITYSQGPTKLCLRPTLLYEGRRNAELGLSGHKNYNPSSLKNLKMIKMTNKKNMCNDNLM